MISPIKCLAALALLLSVGCGGGPRARNNGVKPPISGPGGKLATTVNFSLDDIKGGRVSLSDFRGQVVLVTFFTTWCDPCIAEIPALNDMVDGPTAIEGFKVVAISLDLNPRQLVEQFVEFMGIQYPVLLADEGMLRGDTPFGTVRTIPAAFLVDADGRHVDTFVGMTPLGYIRRRAQELIPARAR
ncbi:MAG: TlpA family protein disulfide reductase [Bradymonadia bacterium]